MVKSHMFLEPDSLIKLTILKTPIEIRALLFHATSKNFGWDDFLKAVTNNYWLAFPMDGISQYKYL